MVCGQALTPEQLSQASGAVPPPPPQNSSTQQGSNDLLNSIKKAGGKAGVSKEQKKARDEKLKQNREKREKNSEGEQTDSKNALFAEIRGGFKLKPVNKNQQSPEKSTPKTKCDMASILARRVAMEVSDSDSDDDRSSASDSEWEDKRSTSKTPQSDGEKRSESPDSGHGSDTTSPSHSVPKTKPPLSPKPVGLKNKPQPSPETKVNNVDPVNNEVPNSPPSSFKDRINFFEFTGR